MATLKEALDIIKKLSCDLNTIVLGSATHKLDTIENFTKENRFASGRVCPICGCIHIVRNSKCAFTSSHQPHYLRCDKANNPFLSNMP